MDAIFSLVNPVLNVFGTGVASALTFTSASDATAIVTTMAGSISDVLEGSLPIVLGVAALLIGLFVAYRWARRTIR